jgi:hypothetical protein
LQSEVWLIEGFEDLRSQGRTSNIANHALVFKLRSLRKKWKQAVAYCLIHTSNKGETLVNFLMEVLGVRHSGGLEVFCYQCDVGANNVKALKMLGVTENTLSSSFRIEKLQLQLLLSLSLNFPTAFPKNMM